MAGVLKQYLDARRTHHPAQLLPEEGWCQAPGFARMSLVWPWYAVEDPAPLVDDRGREVGVRPLLEVHAPRSDIDAVLLAWSEATVGGGVPGSGWGESTARAYGGSTRQNVPVVLGGVTGHLVRIEVGQESVWRIVLARAGAVVHLEARAPTRCADAYWQQIDSMLATWGWDD